MAPAEAEQSKVASRPQDRGVARRHAFLQAAREVFLEQGYEVASVNDVVRRAGGSLATLYAQFGNKEGLFLAVVQDQQERFHREIRPDSVDHLPLEEGLTAIGEHYLKALLTRDNLAFYRIVVSEGRNLPALAQRQISLAVDKTAEVVSAYLEARAALETVHVKTSHAAGFFTGMVRARHHYLALSDPSYTLTDAELTEHVRACVQVFLSGAVAR